VGALAQAALCRVALMGMVLVLTFIACYPCRWLDSCMSTLLFACTPPVSLPPPRRSHVRRHSVSASSPERMNPVNWDDDGRAALPSVS
jgi:hypothetical protein